MSVFAGEQAGLFAALKNIVATLLASGRTRLELLANEVAEEKLHLIRLLLLALGMMFFLAMGMLVLLAFLTALFWESRLLVLGLAVAFSCWSALSSTAASTRPCSGRSNCSRPASPSCRKICVI